MGEEKAWNSQWWALVKAERFKGERQQRASKRSKRLPVRKKKEVQ